MFKSHLVLAGKAIVVLSNIVLSMILGAWRGLNHGEGVVGVPVVGGVGIGGGKSRRRSLWGCQGEGDKDGNKDLGTQ